MPKQFKTARQINKLKVIEAAEKLGVSQPTLSAWEGERKSPSIDSLENMAPSTALQPISCSSIL
ncbi:XRE family transcriptional regulator [Petralouisia muris]|uniref:XRE family transcriptional regulator n=1 Tax=Petralouisia muris TaxID=3032872 RepID=A0AC61RUK2_9FIRM|nr:helix-turn-helix transcriptional regulator [Petralouisia muris]TGY95259.1 XRE family transcriptional regulator [Petralouisia muris]